jgi:large subunit ribosomal protein L23
MNQARLMKVLLAPHVTEKTANASDQSNQIAFKVAVDASKPEIKKAVELMFDVEVESVQVLNLKGKVTRFGQMQGRRKNSRKAYVTLKPGHDIDFTGIAE